MNKTLTDSRPAPLSAALALATAATAAAGLFLLTPAAHALAPSSTSQTGTAAFQPISYQLTDAKIARWAVVLKRAPVHATPAVSARVVTTLSTTTSDDTQNIVLTLDAKQVEAKEIWYRVELPILPNNTTGWVQGRYLSGLYTVHTHLYVDRAKLTATLKRDGKTIFTTRVGVGKSYWPTPAGEFYVRDKLTNFNDPFYGPVAFGTSARSATLTDWPGGGFVGVHGTNEPQLIPGHISHGCIRMKNPAILRLAKLMSVGTPLTVR